MLSPVCSIVSGSSWLEHVLHESLLMLYEEWEETAGGKESKVWVADFTSSELCPGAENEARLEER